MAEPTTNPKQLVFKIGDPSFGVVQWQFPKGFVEKVPPHLRNDMAEAVVRFF